MKLQLILLLLSTFVCFHEIKTVTYSIVDTNENSCYGLTATTTCPSSGQAFYGQDAQYTYVSQNYVDNKDGTVTDLNTDLMWQKTPDTTKRSDSQASSYIKSLTIGNYNDWRLPTIKELYSLADFTGDVNSSKPYINTNYFDFFYPNATSTTVVGQRLIDAQYMTSTVYVGVVFGSQKCSFGYNFADGRIKCYPQTSTRYIRAVRGYANYGVNNFKDLGDGTVLDQATGLMWTKADSQQPYNWKDALNYVTTLKTGGYSDWRLPNTKELHSLVNYNKSPNATDSSKKGPAIDTSYFNVTADWGWYFTSTTLNEDFGAIYICFGLCLGYQNGTWLDVHAAGAQRSDPKSGDNSSYPQGRGPQNDQIRITNFVRAVRLSSSPIDSSLTTTSTTSSTNSGTTSTNTSSSSSQSSSNTSSTSTTSTNTNTNSSKGTQNEGTQSGGITVISNITSSNTTKSQIDSQKTQIQNTINSFTSLQSGGSSNTSTSSTLQNYQNSLNALSQSGNNETLQQQLQRLSQAIGQQQQIKDDQEKVQNTLNDLKSNNSGLQNVSTKAINEKLQILSQASMSGSDYSNLTSILTQQSIFQNTTSLAECQSLVSNLTQLAKQQASIDPLAQVNQTDEQGLKNAQKQINSLIKQGAQTMASLIQNGTSSQYYDSSTGMNFQKISLHNSSNSDSILQLSNIQRSSDGGFAEVKLPQGALSKLKSSSSSADSIVAQIQVQNQSMWSSISQISNFAASGIVNVNFYNGNDTLKLQGLTGNDRLNISIELINQSQSCADVICGYIDETSVKLKYDGTSVIPSNTTNSYGIASCICQAEHTTSFTLVSNTATQSSTKIMLNFVALICIMLIAIISSY